MVCNKAEGGPFKMPAMPPWPRTRVSQSTPFTYTGLDYLGPMYIKDNTEICKVWICLFTCLAVRAIHMEIIRDLSTDQFLLCLRRFIARYGTPKEVTSDNAPQFKLAKTTADKLWRDVTVDPDVKSYVADQGIKWNFIVELAPWMGGFYERLVGLVKRPLRKSIGKVCLTYDQLQTILVEVTAVVNSRPLVYIGDDINSGITLTPSHFLTMNPRIGIPVIDDDGEDYTYHTTPSSTEKLLQIWKRGQRYLNQFWKLWKEDYLLSLRERTRTLLTEQRIQAHTKANVGDVVLIKDNLPRGAWKLGKITYLIPSRDGEVRAAKVKLPSQKIINRPLKLLYPIECPDVPEQKTTTQEDDLLQKKDILSIPRPMRHAAMEARKKMKHYINLVDNTD
ncbi:uncharacterized protein LOC144444347 [Glandiceps talaboti]